MKAGPVTHWRPSADSVASGPTSRKVATPRAASSVTAAANRTVSRTCRTQYSGVHSSAETSPPVTVETNGISGSA